MCFGGRLVQIDRNAPALVHHDRAKIVDAMGLVGMLMGQKHRIDVIDLGVDQLLAQIGRGVDQRPAWCRDRTSARPAANSGGGGFSDSWDRRRPSRARDAARRRRTRSREWSGSASCHRIRGVAPWRTAGRSSRVVCREISSSDTPARLRQHLGDLNHVRRLVALAAKFAGRQIRRVGLDHDAVGRQLGREIAQGLATS